MAEETDYKHNHYVPKWYQKRFMRPDQEKYFYLDLKPETVVRRGHRYKRRELRRLSIWVGWSVFFALAFACIYYLLGESAFAIDYLDWGFSTMVYYSVVTFTTLGFGDVTPLTQLAAWWVMAEVIFGYVMLGGLISIFATKLARRA